MTPRPATPKPQIGDKVFVTENRRDGRPLGGQIVKAGHRWVTIAVTVADSYRREYRMRIETQHEEPGVGVGSSYATPEQHVWDQARAEALRALAAAGISFTYDSPLRKGDCPQLLHNAVASIIAGLPAPEDTP